MNQRFDYHTLKKRIQSIVSIFVTFIYNIVFSNFVSIWAYQAMISVLNPSIRSIKNVLDVGVGTGLPLSKVVQNFSSTTKVVGIDIDKHYVCEAQKLFKKYQNVEIRLQDFYNYNPNEKYDLVILGFSFMLMPSPQKALQKVKQMLSENGKIVFLLTIHKQKSKFKELIKPLMKYLTTIDFGKMTYEDEFFAMLKKFNIKIITSAKLGKDIFKNQFWFSFWNVWVFETMVKKP